MKVSAKTAVVFGAARGIGKACALRLLQGGAKVCVSDILEEAGQETVTEFRETFNENVIFVKCDVSKSNDIDNVFAMTQETFGSIQICVNSVGIMNEKKWELLMDINFGGCVRITQAAKKWMSHGGERNDEEKLSVIHISSAHGLSAHATLPMYCASKHAVVGYVKSLALNTELHGLGGFRVNTICPYCVDTDIIDTYKELTGRTQESIDKLRANKNVCMSPSRVADALQQVLENEALNGDCMVVHPMRGIFVDEAVTNNFYVNITREGREEAPPASSS